MKRLNTINQVDLLELVDTFLPVTVQGPYVVDDSNFIPMSEAVRQLGSNNVGTDIKNTYYDFPDGKDTGIEIPVTRTKNGKDIAEISSSIMEKVDLISEKVKAAKAENSERKAFEQKLADIRSSSTKSE